MADHTGWETHKVTHLLTILQGQVADILHSVSARVTYKDITEALKGRYGDYQLVATYWSQLKVESHYKNLQLPSSN
jgi:hypothetical protein